MSEDPEDHDDTSDERAERKMRFLFALRSRGVTDTRVLTAMERVDRGLFVRGIFADRAYEDMPLPIACGQTISQPSVVGLMTQALQVNPRDTVLEVGTGSGYQAAILAQLCRRGLHGGPLSPACARGGGAVLAAGPGQYHHHYRGRFVRAARSGPL